MPPQLFSQVSRWEAQQTALAEKHNGGKAPSTTAEQTAASNAINKAQCQASKTLDIKVSPQLGRLDYPQLAVVAVPDTLSRLAGMVRAARG